jgi:hypothetical protein
MDLLRSEEGMEALLGVPFFLNRTAAGDAATGHAKLPARLRMVITEYNMMERAVSRVYEYSVWSVPFHVCVLLPFYLSRTLRFLSGIRMTAGPDQAELGPCYVHRLYCP